MNIEQYILNTIHEYDSKGEDHRWLNEDDYDNVAKHIAEDLGQLIGALRTITELDAVTCYDEAKDALAFAKQTASEQLKKFEV